MSNKKQNKYIKEAIFLAKEQENKRILENQHYINKKYKKGFDFLIGIFPDLKKTNQIDWRGEKIVDLFGYKFVICYCNVRKYYLKIAFLTEEEGDNKLKIKHYYSNRQYKNIFPTHMMHIYDKRSFGEFVLRYKEESVDNINNYEKK